MMTKNFSNSLFETLKQVGFLFLGVTPDQCLS